MDEAELAARLTRLTSFLVSSKEGRDDLDDARRLLARFLARGGRVEGDAAVPADLARSLGDLAAAALREAPAGAGAPHDEVDVAVRRMPLRTGATPLSAPAWAVGRRVERSLGPFMDPAGRPFWFDLLPRVRFVAVIRAPVTEPILLVPLHGRLEPATEYKLPEGSIWIRSRLLAADAPDRGYSGLRIAGGTLRLGTRPKVVGDTLQIVAATPLMLEVEPAAAAPPRAGGSPGEEGAGSRSDPPDRARFVFTATGATLDQAGNAGLSAYGTAVKLTHVPAPARYDALLNRVLLPFDATPDRFRIRRVRSELFRPAGSAPVLGGAWALPVTVAAPDALGEAAGAGAVAVILGPGLRAGWRGTADGAVRFGETVLMTEPGNLVLATARTAGPGATQTVRLWQEPGAPRTRSDLVLGYTDTSPLRFLSEAGNADGLLVEAGLEASLDRPVGVDGQRLPLRASAAPVAFWHDAAGFRMLAAATVLSARPQSLALANALIQRTGPLNLLVFGTLADPTRLDSGIAAVLTGVRGILPTLRDPYV
ncbi:MAG TPA: hypothetical protein VK943_07465, partial [Arenibaculum sp.]|nr:hypothetical protein [Arenibaculum sp.]